MIKITDISMTKDDDGSYEAEITLTIDNYPEVRIYVTDSMSAVGRPMPYLQFEGKGGGMLTGLQWCNKCGHWRTYDDCFGCPKEEKP